MGKLLNSGGTLLTGFANQVIFNFVGKNPIQPTVQSSLPLSFIQPLLRGGGRAVRPREPHRGRAHLLYAARTFAQFRQQFIVDMLTGGTISQPGIGFSLQGFSTAGNTDPTTVSSRFPASRRGDHRSQEPGLLRAACRTL